MVRLDVLRRAELEGSVLEKRKVKVSGGSREEDLGLDGV